MNGHRTAAIICLLIIIPLSIQAESDDARKLRNAMETLAQIAAIPEGGIPTALLANARGIAVLPGTVKAGCVLGGRYGTGVLSIQNADGTWSLPAFITLAGGSLGWQIGAQGTDIILVFKSRKGIDAIGNGKLTLGADIAIAAGPVGRQASAATDIELKAEIYSYSRARGLFAGLALEGALLRLDEKANHAWYGTGSNPESILTAAPPRVPEEAKGFSAELKKLMVPRR